ncbi:MAG: penicillin-binding transpeptidase domain-containing protein, partial [Firmicutes bacterium]|nr:penicillin-binding transpeptidase domain-containing protein [Bacillota bacterium]
YGYEPGNYEGKHEGWLSVRRAVETSNNVAAVKVMEYAGMDYSKAFARRLGLSISADDGFAAALGGLKDGAAICEIANGYQAIANGGEQIKTGLIARIVSRSGGVIYQKQQAKFYKFRDDSAYLMTDMLITAAKTGTARALSELPFPVASKTGTVRHKETDCNSDAYNVCYTREITSVVWVGNASNADEKALKRTVTGGGVCTVANKMFIRDYYDGRTPVPFTRPCSVKSANIDLDVLATSHSVVLADENLPQRKRTAEFFSAYNYPRHATTRGAD